MREQASILPPGLNARELGGQLYGGATPHGLSQSLQGLRPLHAPGVITSEIPRREIGHG